MIRLLVGIVALAITSVCFAQSSYTVEGVAQIRDNERAQFSPKSVREFRGKMYFDILVGYRDPADIPVGGFASRKISYAARCDSKDVSIAVIELRDNFGRTVKIITVPPGAEEFYKPAAGSAEGDALYRTCG